MSIMTKLLIFPNVCFYFDPRRLPLQLTPSVKHIWLQSTNGALRPSTVTESTQYPNHQGTTDHHRTGLNHYILTRGHAANLNAGFILGGSQKPGHGCFGGTEPLYVVKGNIQSLPWMSNKTVNPFTK
jgi:hypothetical protein